MGNDHPASQEKRDQNSIPDRGDPDRDPTHVHSKSTHHSPGGYTNVPASMPPHSQPETLGSHKSVAEDCGQTQALTFPAGHGHTIVSRRYHISRSHISSRSGTTINPVGHDHYLLSRARPLIQSGTTIISSAGHGHELLSRALPLIQSGTIIISSAGHGH